MDAQAAEAAAKATKMDEWTPLVKAALTTRFGAKTEQLCALLQKTGGLISGGSILSACIGETVEKQDTDIYVPIKHIDRFLTDLIKSADPIFPAAFHNQYAASFYCTSFLRKNGIKKVYNFANGKFDDPWSPKKGERVRIKSSRRLGVVVWANRNGVKVKIGDNRDMYDSSELEQEDMKAENEVDIMSIRNKRTPLEVVNNFDLTFCQVWFDGADVYASHPDHITAKKGELRYEYCSTLLGGNRFLKKRLQKYLRRGFAVTLDEKFTGADGIKNIISKIVSPANLCDIESKDRYEDPEFKERWFNRIAMRFFLGKHSSYITHEKYLNIPLDNAVYHAQADTLNKDGTLINKLTKAMSCCKIGEYVIEVDDGYDSEDMDKESLKKIAVANYKGPDTADDLKYYRTCTKLVFNAKTDLSEYGAFNLGSLAKQRMTKTLANKLIGIIEERALRTGDDIMADNGMLFDIHEHGINEAITRESLEGYLESTMAGDSYDVKCYAAGGGAHAGCTKQLLQSEIEIMVSPEFYKRYSAPRPRKTGLDQNVGNFDAVFKNIRSTDPAWGDIYHATMCPYCVSFEERGDGCSVMTHINPKGLEPMKAPYCPADKQVNTIFQKYKDAGERLDGDGYVRLEWCVECGRPSSRHQHFNLDATEMIDHRKIPDPKNPGYTIYDYGSCPGGGRPEMIARMMAVGDVYRRRDIRDPKEERRLAAEAADKAPLDPALMAKAQELWDSAQPHLEWLIRRESAVKEATKDADDTAPIEKIREAEKTAKAAFDAANPRPPSVDFSFPRSKMYNDPLYEREDATNDPDYKQWLTGAPAGGRLSFKRRRGKTPKKARRTRKA